MRQELTWDKYFTQKGVVFFAESGDYGLGVSTYPGASPNVVSVGGTYFNRDRNGNFVNEVYYTGAGGGDLSPYEPRPAYQNGVAGIVGSHRGYPRRSSRFLLCADLSARRLVFGRRYKLGVTYICGNRECRGPQGQEQRAGVDGDVQGTGELYRVCPRFQRHHAGSFPVQSRF